MSTTQAATAPLMERLMERQIHEGWSEAQMAAQLGISASYWRALRGHRRGGGLDFISNVVKRFPEYEAEALFAARTRILGEPAPTG